MVTQKNLKYGDLVFPYPCPAEFGILQSHIVHE